MIKFKINTIRIDKYEIQFWKKKWRKLDLNKYIFRINYIPGLNWLQHFLTSASVGFWPNALNTSPNCEQLILPSPLLSNKENASWYSIWRKW